MRRTAGTAKRRGLLALLGPLLGATILFWALLAAATPPPEQPLHGAAGHGTTTQGKAHGKAHGEPPINWTSFDYRGSQRKWVSAPFLFTLINFGLLVYLLVRVARKPLGSYLAERHAQITADLDEAARLRSEAGARLAAVDARLANLDKEIAELKAAVAADAELERQRIIGNAEQEADALVGAAERTLQVELERAKRHLEVSAVRAALQTAEKLLKKEVGDQDARRLRDEYFAQIDQMGGGH